MSSASTSLAAGHLPHAVGVAHAMKLRSSSQAVLAACGEGATSLGDWYEAANWAAGAQAAGGFSGRK
jgi:TPP-dependent pyruvate/acetoin dehydrogenase alpha subunit